MVSFCCCKMKDHSYFLLINYITSAIFGAALEGTTYYNIFPAGVVAMQLIFSIFTWIFVLINVIAFFHYVFGDNIYSSYHRFYISFQIIYLIATLGWTVIGILIVLVLTLDAFVVALMIISGIISLIFLSFLLAWSLKLKKVIYKEYTDDDELEMESEDIEANLVEETAKEKVVGGESVKSIKKEEPKNTSERIEESKELENKEPESKEPENKESDPKDEELKKSEPKETPVNAGGD